MTVDRPVADLVIDRAEVDGTAVTVEVAGANVTYCGPARDVLAAERIDAAGRAVLPGLHDHHIHLLATAAALASLDLSVTADNQGSGPTTITDRLRVADAALHTGDWLRVVGYHESMTGDTVLDRMGLDAMVHDRPTRMQHRSGMLWVLNTAALAALPSSLPAGAELHDGAPTGRFWREDEWLRRHLPSMVPDVTPVLDTLAGFGVTSVTDMTPFDRADDLAVLAAAVHGHELRVIAAGAPTLTTTAWPNGLQPGPVKVLLDDGDLPPLDDLVDTIRAAHTVGRTVAMHCVTRTALAFLTAAFHIAGGAPGDRIEHGAVVPPELRDEVRRLGLTVVTQPGFLCRRGEQYRRDVEPDDLPHLWPCRSLLDAGIPVAGSSDAPYGPIDPWTAMAAAVTRRTEAGRTLGEHEAVDARTALAMWLSPGDRAGGPPRRVEAGAVADLCLLDRPLAAALQDLSGVRVSRVVTSTPAC